MAQEPPYTGKLTKGQYVAGYYRGVPVTGKITNIDADQSGWEKDLVRIWVALEPRVVIHGGAPRDGVIFSKSEGKWDARDKDYIYRVSSSPITSHGPAPVDHAKVAARQAYLTAAKELASVAKEHGASRVSEEDGLAFFTDAEKAKAAMDAATAKGLKMGRIVGKPPSVRIDLDSDAYPGQVQEGVYDGKADKLVATFPTGMAAFEFHRAAEKKIGDPDRVYGFGTDPRKRAVVLYNADDGGHRSSIPYDTIEKLAKSMGGVCKPVLRGADIHEATKDAQDFVSGEIKHLKNDKGYEQDRAVAAALNVARDKGYDVGKKTEAMSDVKLFYKIRQTPGGYWQVIGSKRVPAGEGYRMADELFHATDGEEQWTPETTGKIDRTKNPVLWIPNRLESRLSEGPGWDKAAKTLLAKSEKDFQTQGQKGFGYRSYLKAVLDKNTPQATHLRSMSGDMGAGANKAMHDLIDLAGTVSEGLKSGFLTSPAGGYKITTYSFTGTNKLVGEAFFRIASKKEQEAHKEVFGVRRVDDTTVKVDFNADSDSAFFELKKRAKGVDPNMKIIRTSGPALESRQTISEVVVSQENLERSIVDALGASSDARDIARNLGQTAVSSFADQAVRSLEKAMSLVSEAVKPEKAPLSEEALQAKKIVERMGGKPSRVSESASPRRRLVGFLEEAVKAAHSALPSILKEDVQLRESMRRVVETLARPIVALSEWKVISEGWTRPVPNHPMYYPTYGAMSASDVAKLVQKAKAGDRAAEDILGDLEAYGWPKTRAEWAKADAALAEPPEQDFPSSHGFYHDYGSAEEMEFDKRHESKKVNEAVPARALWYKFRYAPGGAGMILLDQETLTPNEGRIKNDHAMSNSMKGGFGQEGWVPASNVTLRKVGDRTYLITNTRVSGMDAFESKKVNEGKREDIARRLAADAQKARKSLHTTAWKDGYLEALGEIASGRHPKSVAAEADTSLIPIFKEKPDFARGWKSACNEVDSESVPGWSSPMDSTAPRLGNRLAEATISVGDRVAPKRPGTKDNLTYGYVRDVWKDDSTSGYRAGKTFAQVYWPEIRSDGEWPVDDLVRLGGKKQAEADDKFAKALAGAPLDETARRSIRAFLEAQIIPVDFQAKKRIDAPANATMPKQPEKPAMSMQQIAQKMLANVKQLWKGLSSAGQVEAGNSDYFAASMAALSSMANGRPPSQTLRAMRGGNPRAQQGIDDAVRGMQAAMQKYGVKEAKVPEPLLQVSEARGFNGKDVFLRLDEKRKARGL